MFVPPLLLGSMLMGGDGMAIVSVVLSDESALAEPEQALNDAAAARAMTAVTAMTPPRRSRKLLLM
ncbi:hypothetical protein GCM10011399_06880 [Subtercola lobariae]|uniref:Uncharacterized protein n=1 Tax=Subtercola lobariae TaxID=1588641 RepID=A0A917B1Y5_9MICO|nr:hypothetical protein GCM10011399_06880 [Subtercola lobariae]